MAPFAVELPSHSAHQPPDKGTVPSVGETTHALGPETQIHAQDSERVYQAAGNQIILNHALPTPAMAANTLPRNVATFAGRSEEVDRLLKMVRRLTAFNQPIPVVTIDGMPGVGKTTFAVQVGHQLAPSFPDGQIFIDMHAHTAGKVPVEPAEALFALLSVDGMHAGSIPDDVDERSARWRARMANRRSILIIDNVASHHQVEPLLPGSAGCLVIVTSRRRLTGLRARYAATAVQLDPLPPHSAAELFCQLTGRAAGEGQDRAVKELVDLCGCLPLAISLLAARLRPEPQWRVQTMVDRLAAAQDRLSYISAEDVQVSAAFDISYRSLPTARRRFFRRLGLSPGIDFDEYAAAALAGVELDAARRHLDALYEDHLVEQPVQGRYRLHDLFGVYTRALVERDGSAQRDLAVGRLLDYYQHTATVADQHLVTRPRPTPNTPARPLAQPILADAAQAAAWLDTELPNLMACAIYAMSHGDDSRLIGLAAALAMFLRRAGPYRQSVALHRAAADAAGRRGDLAARAACLYNVGILLRRPGDYPAAIQVLDEARGLRQELGDQAGEADVLTAAGIVRRLAGDYSAATELLNEALARYDALGDPAGQAEAHDELAVVHWLTDDYTTATRLLDQALALYRQAESSQGQADVLLHLGIVRRLQHNYPAAIEALMEARTRYRRLGARMGLANTQLILGMVRWLTGDYPGAAGSLVESLRAYKEVGDRLGHANALKELGIVRRLTGDHSGAAQALLEALSVYEQLRNQLGQAGTLQDLAMVWWQTGNANRAGHDLATALEIYENLRVRSGQADVLNLVGMLLLEAGEPQALDRFAVALRLAREVQNPLTEARALDGIGRWHLHQRDIEKAVVQLRAALRIYQRIGAPEATEVEGTLASLAQDQSTTCVSDDDGR